MKVLVLGAGVVGVSSAWYLAAAGHEVTVIDRQPAAGLETSFANGGQISVSHAEPWANPHAPAQALAWFGREDAPLLFRPRWDPALFAWMRTQLGANTPIIWSPLGSWDVDGAPSDDKASAIRWAEHIIEPHT